MADTTRPLLKTAVIYDFDGTLARGNMQEVSFIPSIGMTPAQFWNETVRPRTIASDGDGILMYMQMMLLAAREQGAPVTRQTLRDHGRDVALFEGLRDRSWFDRMNAFGAQFGLEIEHYIISAGLTEMIEGCPIAEAFTHVFASKYAYDEDDVAVWPAVGVNYTTKTQYLFRINKGVHNHWEDERINRFIPDEERPIPFDRMIFLGDGDTDVPTMKMMHTKGAGDYREGSPVDLIVKGLIGRIAVNYGRMPAD
ncbi:MAG: phosphoserine phosphatase [Brevundimonas diminuta]|nr:MAG: phosphoserine phosphatase [Brevundimonas diminuta]